MQIRSSCLLVSNRPICRATYDVDKPGDSRWSKWFPEGGDWVRAENIKLISSKGDRGSLEPATLANPRKLLYHQYFGQRYRNRYESSYSPRLPRDACALRMR